MKMNLTAHQVRILKMLEQGMTNAQIAEVLGIEERTVKNELEILFLKLGARNRTDAVVKALKSGIIEL